MAAIVQFPFFFGVPLLPARRVIAIDPGVRNVKVVFAELFLGRARFLHRALLPVDGRDNEKPEDLSSELRELIDKLGAYPLALALPQHLTSSQVVEMPQVGDAALARLIQAETFKLAGLSQSKIASDHTRLNPFGNHHNAYWLTFCQEGEVGSLVERLSLPREDVCEVTSTGNALRSAYLAKFPQTAMTVLADIGYRSTTVAILFEGQAVHASSFALGTELLAEIVAQSERCPLEDAEDLLQTKNLLSGPEAIPGFVSAIDNWRQELIRLVDEWLHEHLELRLDLAAFQFVLSGGGAACPGLLEYLNRVHGALHFAIWPSPNPAKRAPDAGLFAVAEGLAIQALGKTRHSASLLPQGLRATWRDLRASQRLQSLSFLLLLIVMALLGVGTWSQLQLEERKQKLLNSVNLALERADQASRLVKQMGQNYDRLRPAMERRKLTLDTLQALSLMQQARSNRSLWFVLLADDQSYLNAPSITATNEPAPTNVVDVVGPTVPPALTAGAATNRPALRPGFVAEVCIPEEGDAQRRTLSQLVSFLKQSPNFKNVDTVPLEQRRSLANPKTVLPERHFAIAMELVDNEFRKEPKGTNAPAVKPVPAGYGPAAPGTLPPIGTLPRP